MTRPADLTDLDPELAAELLEIANEFGDYQGDEIGDRERLRRAAALLAAPAPADPEEGL